MTGRSVAIWVAVGILPLLWSVSPSSEARATGSEIAAFSTHAIDVRDWQRGVAVADLDRDGMDEIVVSSDFIDCSLPVVGASSGAGPCIAVETIRVFRNGTVRGQTWQVREHPAPVEILAGDLNRDQYPDLVSTYPGLVEIRFNDGTGLFGAPESHPGPGPGYLAIADFDGDSHNDLLALGRSGAGIVLRSISPDSLAPEEVNLGVVVRQVAVVDANHDGRPDLAVTVDATGGYRLRLYPGTADTWFGDPIIGPLLGHSIVAGDFDRDGAPDIVDDQGRFLKGAGDGTFSPPVMLETPRADRFDEAGSLAAPILPGSIDDITAVDINLDDCLDLVTRTGQPMINVWFGRGDGTFLPPLAVATAQFPWLIGRGWFNADDHPDLVVLSYQGNNATVLLNTDAWPTATSIVNARATWEGTAIDIHWTISEEKKRNLYAVMRGPSEQLERLTSRPLTGQIDFHWRDEHPLPGSANYWIEETTPLGAIGLFGPITSLAPVAAAMEVGLPHPNPSRGAVAFH
jgi:hypothetical protein